MEGDGVGASAKPQQSAAISTPSIDQPRPARQVQDWAHQSHSFVQIANNPFFAGGLGLAGLGAVVAVTQRSLRHAAAFLKRRLLVDVEINVKDESYSWFLRWMTAHQRSQLPSISVRDGIQQRGGSNSGMIQRFLTQITPRMHHLSIQTDVVKHPNGSVQTRFSLLPGPGKHLLRYKNSYLTVERVRETKAMDLPQGRPWETIILTTLYSQRHLLEELFREAHHLAQQSVEGKTVIYTSRGSSWELFGDPRRKRPFDSVILEKGVKERILGDVKDFLANEEWYHDRGIPYRRGYLLYGSPGSGKSSFIQALASELNYNIAMLNLSERGLTDDRLNYLLTIVPRRTLVLLEDADAAFSNRRMQTDNDGYRGANVTFSGLLNALDGVSSAEERLLFMTTNYADKLDSALIRPGRIDMSVEMGGASSWQAEKLWDRFYGRFDRAEMYKTKFLERLKQLGLVSDADQENSSRQSATSMAALQGLFLYNKDHMEGAISMLQELMPRSPAEGVVTSAYARTSRWNKSLELDGADMRPAYRDQSMSGACRD